MASLNYYSSSLRSHWHMDRDVYAAVRKFHDSCTRFPIMNREKRMHNEILSIIGRELTKDCFGPSAPMNQYLHTGSTKDGVKIGRDGIEFDTMILLKGENTLDICQEYKPGYYSLSPKNCDANPLARITESNFLSSAAARNKFMGRLQKIVNETYDLQRYHGRIQLRAHGPAAQMDIMNDDGTLLYSNDMVPTFEVDGVYYVAKPFREAGNEAPYIWRISYSLDEKRKFKGYDSDNTCRKQTLRVCKAMRLDSPELNPITSYHLKNALFYEVDEHCSSSDWQFDKLAARVLGVWMRIEYHLDQGKMGSYFNPRMDLLDCIQQATKENLKFRIRRFSRNKGEFLSMISRIQDHYIPSSSLRLEDDEGNLSDNESEEADSSDDETQKNNESGISNLAIGIGVGAIAAGLGLAALACYLGSKDESPKKKPK